MGPRGTTKYCDATKPKPPRFAFLNSVLFILIKPSYISVRFTLQGVELIAMESFKDQGIVTGTLRMTGVRSLLGFLALSLHLDDFQ